MILLCASSSNFEGENLNVVNGDDLEYISKLVDEKDGGPAWIQMMDRSTSNMSYQAWRRDPEVPPLQHNDFGELVGLDLRDG